MPFNATLTIAIVHFISWAWIKEEL